MGQLCWAEDPRLVIPCLATTACALSEGEQQNTHSGMSSPIPGDSG